MSSRIPFELTGVSHSCTFNNKNNDDEKREDEEEKEEAEGAGNGGE